MNINELCGREFEQIEVLRDRGHGLTAFVVIHDTRLGPAFGGIRRWMYADSAAALRDGLRLAESMTLKCAISGVPGGGGKAVIVQTPELDRAAAYRAIGRCVAHLGGRYFTGPDVGTSATDLAIVASETENVAQPSARCGDLSEPTALGVFAGIRSVATRLGFDSLDGVHVAVQGLGEVGRRLCARLASAGARLTVTDLCADVALEIASRCAAAIEPPQRILEVECDIFAPCALGGVIDSRGALELRARAVAGSANNVLADSEVDEVLFRRGVLYVPDFVIGSGALIHGALSFLDGEPPPEDRVLAIGDRIGEILDAVRTEGIPPAAIAHRMAREVLDAAERTRR